jgi:hypothetical protein
MREAHGNQIRTSRRTGGRPAIRFRDSLSVVRPTLDDSQTREGVQKENGVEPAQARTKAQNQSLIIHRTAVRAVVLFQFQARPFGLISGIVHDPSQIFIFHLRQCRSALQELVHSVSVAAVVIL